MFYFLALKYTLSHTQTLLKLYKFKQYSISCLHKISVHIIHIFAIICSVYIFIFSKEIDVDKQVDVRTKKPLFVITALKWMWHFSLLYVYSAERSKQIVPGHLRDNYTSLLRFMFSVCSWPRWSVLSSRPHSWLCHAFISLFSYCTVNGRTRENKIHCIFSFLPACRKIGISNWTNLHSLFLWKVNVLRFTVQPFIISKKKQAE